MQAGMHACRHPSPWHVIQAAPAPYRRRLTSACSTEGSGASAAPGAAGCGSGGRLPSCGRCTVVKQMLYSWGSWERVQRAGRGGGGRPRGCRNLSFFDWGWVKGGQARRG